MRTKQVLPLWATILNMILVTACGGGYHSEASEVDTTSRANEADPCDGIPDCYTPWEPQEGQSMEPFEEMMSWYGAIVHCTIPLAHSVVLESYEQLNIPDTTVEEWVCDASLSSCGEGQCCRNAQGFATLQQRIADREDATGEDCTPAMVQRCQNEANGRIYLGCTVGIANINHSNDPGWQVNNNTECASNAGGNPAIDFYCEHLQSCRYDVPPTVYTKADAIAEARNLIDTGTLQFATDEFPSPEKEFPIPVGIGPQEFVPLDQVVKDQSGAILLDVLNERTTLEIGPINPTRNWPSYYRARTDIGVLMKLYPYKDGSGVLNFPNASAASESKCEQDGMQVSTDGGVMWSDVNNLDCACDVIGWDVIANQYGVFVSSDHVAEYFINNVPFWY